MAYTLDPTLSNITDADLAQLITDALAEQKTRAIAGAAETTRADVQTFIDSKTNVAALGATAIADANDGSWVIVEFPTDDPEALTVAERALVLGAMAEMVRSYGAQWVVPGKSVRNRAQQMMSNMGAVEDALVAANG